MKSLQGIGVSGGIGIGTVVKVRVPSLDFKPCKVSDTKAEKRRYLDALESFCTETEQIAEKTESQAADILNGHVAMARDPYMTSEIERLIDEGNCAESSLCEICDIFSQMFQSAEDELTRQRVSDIEDIKVGLLQKLLGVEQTDIASVQKNTVLIAHDLIPSMTAQIRKENVVGIVAEIGGETSHTAILARALEIPAVLNAKDAMATLQNGDTVVVDGERGEVTVNPDADKMSAAKTAQDALKLQSEALKEYIGKPTKTRDGKTVELLGNIGSPEDAEIVIKGGGEGIGLFRTEFLFMNRNDLPGEEEQFLAYKQVALKCKDKPIIIRTLDVGGDKEIPYLGLEREENPFLGWRAVRFCLERDDVFLPQLRALVRASAFGDIRILVPFVTSVDELRAVKQRICDIQADFDKSGVNYRKNLQIGVMIETPSACMMADTLAKEADFFSIGTNDLTQYIMAVDRTNAKVAHLYAAYQPAVLRAVRSVIRAAHKENISVGMCGEAAADKKLIPLWLAFGLDEFSVSPSSILKVRKAISQWDNESAKLLADKVLNCKTASDVLSILNK